MSQDARPLLIVEDDPMLRASIVEHLALSGEFGPVAADSLSSATTLLGSDDARFDGILLDVGLPDGDGNEFCALVRRRGLKMPILMVTGRDGEADVVRGLEAGANDYIVKPFRAGELLARLRAHLRAFDNSDDASFPVGPYVFRPSMKLLDEPGRKRRVRLTDLECRVLKRLCQAKGELVSRQALMEEVWGYKAGTTTHTLETHIYRLRQKIEPRPTQPRLLLSARGYYRLNTGV